MRAAGFSRVLRESTSRCGARTVLMLLAHRAQASGVCWPKQQRIADETALSERQVRRALAWLEENGEIEVRQAKRGRARVNVYRVLLGDPEEVDYDELPFELVEPFSSADDRTFPTLDDRTFPTVPYKEERKGVERKEHLSPAAPSSGKRNIVWDVLAEHFGQPVTESERTDFGKTVREVKQALSSPGLPSGVTGTVILEEAMVRAEIGRRVEAMGDFRSHRSLRNRWGQLGALTPPESPPTGDGIAQNPCECIGSHMVNGEPSADPFCPECGGTGIDGWVS